MHRPYTVTLDLYRGAAYRPFSRVTANTLASSALEACSQAETALNVGLPDIEYAGAVDAHPVWQPRPAAPANAIALAA